MENTQKQIDAFFKAYEDRFNRTLKGEEVDPKETAAAFADYFVEASPVGIQGGKNDREFLEAIPKGNEFYRNIGTRVMRITGKTLIPLDPLHVAVKVHWSAQYARKDREQVTIDFDVTYLLQVGQQGPKIFAYITGDEQKALKENGLI